MTARWYFAHVLARGLLIWAGFRTLLPEASPIRAAAAAGLIVMAFAVSDIVAEHYALVERRRVAETLHDLAKAVRA